jgi:hypothetical protein
MLGRKMQKIYRIYPAKVAPISLALLATYLGFALSPWTFIAIPFIYIGSICATPSLNLVNGFFVLVSVALGFGVALIKKEIGIIIILGATSSWILSAIEKAITAKEIKNELNVKTQPTSMPVTLRDYARTAPGMLAAQF